MIHRWQRRIARVVLLTFGTSLAACGGAEEAPPATTSTVAPSTTAPTVAPTLPTEAPEQLSQQQLRELVAPVALYPDVVLASLLPATTYPDQITDAAQYVAQQNGQVQAVPEDRAWDGSVAGLLQFPDVLTWLDQNDEWTEQMGSAVAYQQADVLQAVQDYRREAMNAGNLESNEYMTVRQDPDQDVRIEPAKPDTVYVPSYDPVAVTQPQEKSGINPWLAFGGGVAVGALGAWALYSIFDDDDDDDDHRHHGRRRTINQYNNYYYGGANRPRPRPVEWQPRPGRRVRRAERRETVFRPEPYRPVYSSKPAQRPAQQAGVRPPERRPGFGQGQGGGGGRPKDRPGGVSRPATPAPMGAEPRKDRPRKRRDQQAAPKVTPAPQQQRREQQAPAPDRPKKRQGQGAGQGQRQGPGQGQDKGKGQGKERRAPQASSAPAERPVQQQAPQGQKQGNKKQGKKKKQGGGDR